MKLFNCQNCGQVLYFENIQCESCGHALGFDSSQSELLTLVKLDYQAFSAFRNKENHYRYCANAQYDACNWVIPVGSQCQYCDACKLNETIPNLGVPERMAEWKKLEIAKHRLVYTLLKLDLPLSSKRDDSQNGLVFDFLAEEDADEKVIMGHDDGRITINLAEADDTRRVAMREKLHEPYRTLAGHFRHESGHYYWDQMIKNSPEILKKFRSMFGDESADYGEALKKYYKGIADNNWRASYVSMYATAHPWEDWAETWAHYLHIIDTLETAYFHGIKIKPIGDNGNLSSDHKQDPFSVYDFKELITLWYPLTLAVNSLNRSMGQPDFYPFVIASPVVKKLDFIHRLCKRTL